MPRHLVLVGMMGTGKTTIGRVLAERLHRPLVDSDAEIERRTGRTVREIFAADGEAAFRTLETAVLHEALEAAEPNVIAAAGGVVIRPENRAALKRSDVRVVWLQASTATLAERVQRGGHRPLLDDDPAGVLSRLLAEREPWYTEVADIAICSDGRSPSEIADAVLR